MRATSRVRVFGGRALFDWADRPGCLEVPTRQRLLTKAAAVSSAGFASGGRRRCACGTMCFVALERRRARDTSLPDWCEIQDNDRFVTLETFGSKFPGGLLPADLRAAVAACSHSGGGGGRYSPAGFCCCCFGSPPLSFSYVLACSAAGCLFFLFLVQGKCAGGAPEVLRFLRTQRTCCCTRCECCRC